MSDREPVTGRYYSSAGAAFVSLDVTPLVENNVHDLLDLLSSDEFFEEFIAATAPARVEHDGHAPDRLAFEELKDRLVERLATRAALTAPQALRTGDRLASLALALGAERETTPGVPVQQDRRAS